MSVIFIPKNVPSSKNSKQWTGKYLIHSKTVTKYIKETKADWINNKNKFLQLIKNKQKPYYVKFTFIRDSKRKFDYINPCQTVQDLMEKYGYVENDNCENIIPCFGVYTVDKQNAGVKIEVL
jgi:hypothetical protein